MRKILVVLLTLSMLMVMTSCMGGEGMNKDIEKVFATVCSADEALALAKSSDVVVIEEKGCTSGQKVWDSFYKDVSGGMAATVLVADYYTIDKEHVSEELYEQEKDQYPQLYFCLVKFDGKKYSIDTRLSTSSESDKQETYNCLQHYTGDAPTEDALYDKYEYYVLTDDANVTWDEIMASMLDSSSPDFIKHYTVYSNFTGWKGK